MYPFYRSQRPYEMQKRQQKSYSTDNRREFRSTQLPTLPSKLVTHYCNMISQKSSEISTSELTYSLDKLARELEHHNSEQQETNLIDIFAVLILVRSSTLVSVAKHHFFTLLRTSLIQILQQWRRASKLDENEVFMFRNITKLLKILFKKAKDIDIYPSWLSDSLLLETIVSCLTDIAVSGKFLHETNDHEVKIFTRLLNIYANYQELLSNENSLDQDKLVQLLDPISQCLTSPHYINSFNRVSNGKSSLSAGDKFFLVKCPIFLTSYTGSRLDQTMNTLLSTMLPQYVTLFDRLIPLVQQWKRSMMRSVNQLLTIVRHGSTNAKVVADHLPFIDHILKIIDTPTIYDNLQETLSNPETILINTAVSFLVDMIGEPIILAHIKQKKVTSSFLRFTSVKYEPLMYNTDTILAFITTEEDIKGMHNPGMLLSTVVKSLKTAIDRKSDSRDEIDQLLETLKGLVQHDQMKEEVLKQNALTFLLECTDKLTQESLKLLLETLWTMTFLKEAATILHANSAFIEKIQRTSKTSSDEGVKKAADGLVWKLVREQAFLEKVAEKDEEEGEMGETTLVKTTKVVIGEDGKEKIVTATARTSIAHAERIFQYDIMISYCHADKDLIIRLHKFLLSQGFKVWIDLDNMFGPAMSAMADAVENSEFVILCMSDSYKRSTYCQAEAEYAFNCKRRLVPLIARPGYKADGWLGFMIGSRIYIDYGFFEFDVACEKLMNEISRQKKAPLPAKVGQPIQHEKPAVTAPVVEKKPEKSALKSYTQAVPDVYMNRKAGSDFNRKSIDYWLESDVLDFLFTHHLHELMPVCEQMNGRALVQLYKMCSSSSNRTYTLLNDELKSAHHLKLPISTYTRFLSVIEGVVPPPPTPMHQSLPSPMYQPLPSPSIPVIQSPAPVDKLPYDILVTSNASPSQMLQMVAHMGRQLRANYPEQRHITFST